MAVGGVYGSWNWLENNIVHCVVVREEGRKHSRPLNVYSV